MPKKSRLIRAPSEFDDWLGSLARQEAQESGDTPSKSRVMRLMTNQFKDKMIFRGKRIDFKIF